MGGAPVEVQPDKLLPVLAFAMQQQATFHMVPYAPLDPLDPRSCPGFGGGAVHISLLFSSFRSDLPRLFGSTRGRCSVAGIAESLEIGVSLAAH